MRSVNKRLERLEHILAVRSDRAAILARFSDGDERAYAEACVGVENGPPYLVALLDWGQA